MHHQVEDPFLSCAAKWYVHVRSLVCRYGYRVFNGGEGKLSCCCPSGHTRDRGGELRRHCGGEGVQFIRGTVVMECINNF